jgi:hypothetical protein
MGNISIKMSTQSAQSTPQSIFKFEEGSVFNNSNQNYMSVSLKPHVLTPETTGKKYGLTNFMINNDANTSFLTDIKTKIHAAMPNNPIQLMSPVYFDISKPNEKNTAKKPIATDYQRSVTETGKPGEALFDIANRGLIEELGLTFITNPQFTEEYEHYCTRDSKYKESKYQHCKTYIVHCSQLEPATVNSCIPYLGKFDLKDYKGPKINGRITENKAQVFIFGTKAELEDLIKKIKLKPLKHDQETSTLHFYDKDILGVTTYSIDSLT